MLHRDVCLKNNKTFFFTIKIKKYFVIYKQGTKTIRVLGNLCHGRAIWGKALANYNVI